MSEGVHEIPDLDRKGLRDFGLVTGTIIAVLFGLFFPWALDAAFPAWPWVVFGVLGVWARTVPLSLKPVYRVWMRIGLLLSKVTTPIIMGAVFFLVIFPVALVLRIGRWDAMQRKLDAGADTYRIERQSPSKDSLENPF